MNIDPLKLSELIQEIVQTERRQRFVQSPQLDLGDLIRQLKAINDQTKTIAYDFEYAVPTTLDSWRGAYSELALGFDVTVGHSLGREHDPTVAEILTECERAIGKTFTGWKGGKYVMSGKTPVWVANPGNAGNTGIVAITDRGWQVTIDTAYFEY